MARTVNHVTSVVPDADDVMASAHDLVLLWDRAEDWVTPRIPPLQVRVLTVLEQHGSMNLTQLARAVRTIPSSASRLCDRLEAAGLVERETSVGSRREITLRLTVEGRHRLDSFARIRREDFASVLEEMSVPARRALLKGLTAFSEATAHNREPRNREA
ncbi:MarR family transcriptional regulator [Leekyejoonella antrihumi]|nr:MarR family transcriptional regulator [Leekyejoonella antrihumi]